MKKFYFLLLSLLFLQCSAEKMTGFIKTYNTDDYIYWSANRKLSWKDFKGKPADTSDVYTSEVFMSIPSYYQKDFPMSQPKLTSLCVFDSRNSWVNNKFANDTILLYNQILFDIHEVYARTLRKTVAETDFGFTTDTDKYQSITRKNQIDLMDRVEKFRRESNFGQNFKVVLKWSANVKKELNSLKNYSVDYKQTVQAIRTN